MSMQPQIDTETELKAEETSKNLGTPSHVMIL